MLTPDIVIVFAVIAGAVVLFLTEWVRYDFVALAVLLALAISGVVPMNRAIEGFANPAVLTIAAVLVLSGGLHRTGVANLIGAQMMRFAGKSTLRVTALVMLTSGLMSGVMNNIAATALLLPVVLNMARRLGLRPSRLLIPLAFASLLGGMTTLIGTGPNILLSAFLEQSGQGSFGLFSFTPVGAAALLLGIAYVTLAGRFFLPNRSSGQDTPSTQIDTSRYGLEETLLALRIPRGSALDGMSLERARLGQAIGIDLLAVRRNGRHFRAPGPDFLLRSRDVLLCQGGRKALDRLRAWGHLTRFDDSSASPWDLLQEEVALATVEVAAESRLIGETVHATELRSRLGVHILAIWRGDDEHRTSFERVRLQAGDTMLLIGRSDRLESLHQMDEFSSEVMVDIREAFREYGLGRWIMRLEIPPESVLDGMPLSDSRLRQGFDLNVIEIQREGASGRETMFLPGSSVRLRSGDRVVLHGNPESWIVLGALQQLKLQDGLPSLTELTSERVGYSEFTLAPGSVIAGKALGESNIRESFGLTLMAIWRRGRSTRTDVGLSETRLQFGDALLMYGPRRRMQLMARDERFLMLTSGFEEVFRLRRAPVAGAIMAGVILSAAMNLLPVYIATLTGALLMVLTGCLKGSEVYAAIEWRVIVLLGGMLALGLAMEESGAAELIAREVIARAAVAGPRVLIGALFLLCGLAAQFIPTSAVAVLVAPIALSTAAELDLSVQALFMVVAVGSSCAFVSPFGHPVNLLVMGAGGYKILDYTRVGAPLLVLLLVLVVFFLPAVWPL